MALWKCQDLLLEIKGTFVKKKGIFIQYLLDTAAGLKYWCTLKFSRSAAWEDVSSVSRNATDAYEALGCDLRKTGTENIWRSMSFLGVYIGCCGNVVVSLWGVAGCRRSGRGNLL